MAVTVSAATSNEQFIRGWEKTALFGHDMTNTRATITVSDAITGGQA
jgi:hypothetical protein